MAGPDARKPARREIVAALIGAEVGAGLGVFALGMVPLAPLTLAALGAAVGAGAMTLRNRLLRRWLRGQLHEARQS